jgi:DNA-binding HxlR family transcriptional regulator
MEKKYRSRCPITYALDIFGDKWSLLILRDIIFREKSHYQEFLNAEESISTNILADRLNLLQKHDLIQKRRDSNNKKQYIYEATVKSKELIPMMVEIICWSAKHDNETGVSKEMKEEILNNKQEFIQNTFNKSHI